MQLSNGAIKVKTPGAATALSKTEVNEFEGVEEDWQMANVKSFPYLEYNPITIDGNTGNDTVDISALESAHRIVFTSN